MLNTVSSFSPDSVWGQQHQTAPTESTCSPLSPPTIAFVLALSSPSGYDPQQAAPNSWGCSTKEPRLCPTTKRNYKPASWEHKCLMPPPQNMEGSSSLCATLHGLCPSHVRVGSPLWAQTWGAAAPPSTPTVLYTTDSHPSTPLTATQHPTDIHPNCAAHLWQPPSTPLTVTQHPNSAVHLWQPPSTPTVLHSTHSCVWLPDRQKAWWKLYLSSCWWKAAEQPTCANRRERTFPDQRVSAAQ